MERQGPNPLDVVLPDATTVAQNIARWRLFIRKFIYDMWGLTAQEVKPEYQEAWESVIRSSWQEWERAKKTVQAKWFGDFNTETKEWEWYSFVKGKNYSWQQNLILIGIEKAMTGDAERKISIRSGHGIGKSATCTWIALWFLLCFFDSQTAVTAPTTGQMHDVLWKELSIWINRMPGDVKKLYQWQRDYVRVAYNPESWFARAKTSTKENTEAMAGVHGEHVLIMADEASGVPNQVYETAEGALTSSNVLVILISNPTQTTGYFYDTHHKDARAWQLFAFDSEESPLVDKKFVADKERRHGRDSEEFGIRVKGKFPKSGSMDDGGYIQLIPLEKVSIRLKSDFEIPFIGRTILGVDPAGEGKDTATFVLRDRFKMELIDEMPTSNDKEIAERILTFKDRYKILPEDIVVGAFGTGADVGKEIALAGAKARQAFEIYTVMEGDSPEKQEGYNSQFFERMPDEFTNPEAKPEDLVDLYANMRALMYFRLRKWIFAGGMWVDSSNVDNSAFAEQCSVIRYKRTLLGNKIQLMSKKEMKKLGFASPNITDAAALTMLRTLDEPAQSESERKRIEAEQNVMDEDERFKSV